MKKHGDSSWDLGERVQIDLPFNEVRFNEKSREREERDWMGWLGENLSFTFTAKRVSDDDDAYFTDVAEREPFRLGHTMAVLGLECEIIHYGIIVKVRERRRIGYVPLIDLEVLSESDPNCSLVREYVEWFANR